MAGLARPARMVERDLLTDSMDLSIRSSTSNSTSSVDSKAAMERAIDALAPVEAEMPKAEGAKASQVDATASRKIALTFMIGLEKGDLRGVCRMGLCM